MNPESPTPREQLEARLTALLLHELPAEEAAALREAIAQNPELAALEARLAQTIAIVREAGATPATEAAEQSAPIRLSAERREKLLAHFKTVAPQEFAAPRRARNVRVLVLAAAAAVVLIGAVAALLPGLTRAKLTAAQSAAIQNNLSEIDGAKQTWAIAQHMSPNDVPTASDLAPYLGRIGGAVKPVAGETYDFGNLKEPPKVEIAGVLGHRSYAQNNLKQIGAAYRTWEGDYGDKYPRQLVGAKQQQFQDDIGKKNALPSVNMEGRMSISGQSDATLDAIKNKAIGMAKAEAPANREAEAGVGSITSGTTIAPPPPPAMANIVLPPTSDTSAEGATWSLQMRHQSGNAGIADGSVQQTADLTGRGNQFGVASPADSVPLFSFGDERAAYGGYAGSGTAHSVATATPSRSSLFVGQGAPSEAMGLPPSALSSANSDVLRIEGSKVVGVGPGTTTVSATLANNTTVSKEVTVQPIQAVIKHEWTFNTNAGPTTTDQTWNSVAGTPNSSLFVGRDADEARVALTLSGDRIQDGEAEKKREIAPYLGRGTAPAVDANGNLVDANRTLTGTGQMTVPAAQPAPLETRNFEVAGNTFQDGLTGVAASSFGGGSGGGGPRGFYDANPSDGGGKMFINNQTITTPAAAPITAVFANTAGTQGSPGEAFWWSSNNPDYSPNAGSANNGGTAPSLALSAVNPVGNFPGTTATPPPVGHQPVQGYSFQRAAAESEPAAMKGGPAAVSDGVITSGLRNQPNAPQQNSQIVNLANAESVDVQQIVKNLNPQGLAGSRQNDTQDNPLQQRQQTLSQNFNSSGPNQNAPAIFQGGQQFVASTLLPKGGFETIYQNENGQSVVQTGPNYGLAAQAPTVPTVGPNYGLAAQGVTGSTIGSSANGQQPNVGSTFHAFGGNMDLYASPANGAPAAQTDANSVQARNLVNRGEISASASGDFYDTGVLLAQDSLERNPGNGGGRGARGGGGFGGGGATPPGSGAPTTRTYPNGTSPAPVTVDYDPDSGNLIVLTDDKSFESVSNLVQQLDQPRNAAENGNNFVNRQRYFNQGDMIVATNAALSSQGGSFNRTTNSLFVEDQFGVYNGILPQSNVDLDLATDQLQMENSQRVVAAQNRGSLNGQQPISGMTGSNVTVGGWPAAGNSNPNGWQTYFAFGGAITTNLAANGQQTGGGLDQKDMVRVINIDGKATNAADSDASSRYKPLSASYANNVDLFVSPAPSNVYSVNVVGYVNVLSNNTTVGDLEELKNISSAPGAAPVVQQGEENLAATRRVREIAKTSAPVPAVPQAAPAVAEDRSTPQPPAPLLVPQPETLVQENAFSTFSLNVSDVAFKLSAASLQQGRMPDPGSVRSEEFINAFDYRDPDPAPGQPVGFAWERARYPFAHNRDLLRFSIKTASAGRQPGRPLNLVLLLDNSGSMERADRVAIIREALRVLAAQLQPGDKISIVTFSRTARLWVDGIAGDRAGQVLELISELTPEGGTNLGDALDLAYATALRHYMANGVNRVVVLTDGAANLGNVNPETLKLKVQAEREQGIALDCFGIGWEDYNDDLLEVLTRNGDGRYGFINSPEDAAEGFAGQLAGALHVAASDVKVQVEFNPNRVISWRQIGYAKHQLTKEQFRDNTVHAAQIGAAEAGNGLYTVELNPQGTGPICTVRLRYRDPGTSNVSEKAWDIPYNGEAVALDQASPAMRLAATASAFSEWLAQSPYAGDVTTDQLLNYLRGVPAVFGADTRPQQLEWMIRQAKSLTGK